MGASAEGRHTDPVVDTASTALFLPKSAAEKANKMIHQAYYDSIQERWLVPCRTGRKDYEDSLAKSDRTPIFTIDLGNRTFGVPVEDMVVYPLEPADPATVGGRKDMCNSGCDIALALVAFCHS